MFYTLYKSPNLGLLLTAGIIGLGSFICIVPKVFFDIPHYYELAKWKSLETGYASVKHHFYGTQQHLHTYAFGILTGYLIRKHPNLYFGGRIGELFLWVFSWWLTFYSMWWTRDWTSLSYVVDETELYIWQMFGKLMFIAGWSWLLYACGTGRGGENQEYKYSKLSI